MAGKSGLVRGGEGTVGVDRVERARQLGAPFVLPLQDGIVQQLVKIGLVFEDLGQ